MLDTKPEVGQRRVRSWYNYSGGMRVDIDDDEGGEEVEASEEDE